MARNQSATDDLAKLSHSEAAGLLFTRLFAHVRQSNPLVHLDLEVVEWVDQTAAAIRRNKALHSPCWGLWGMVWSSISTQACRTRSPRIAIGAAAVEFCAHIGEVIAHDGVCHMPPWLAALALQQLHSQFSGEDLLYSDEVRALFGPKKAIDVLKLTTLGGEKLGLRGALVLA